MTTWKLDTENDGCDESGLTGTRDEVMQDVMAHHELSEWPEHWTLEEDNRNSFHDKEHDR